MNHAAQVLQDAKTTIDADLAKATTDQQKARANLQACQQRVQLLTQQQQDLAAAIQTLKTP